MRLLKTLTQTQLEHCKYNGTSKTMNTDSCGTNNQYFKKSVLKNMGIQQTECKMNITLNPLQMRHKFALWLHTQPSVKQTG